MSSRLAYIKRAKPVDNRLSACSAHGFMTRWRKCAREDGSSPSKTFSGFKSPCTSPCRCMFATATCSISRERRVLMGEACLPLPE